MKENRKLETLRKRKTAAEERPTHSVHQLQFRMQRINALREKIKAQEIVVGRALEELELQKRWLAFCETGGEPVEEEEEDPLVAEFSERAPDHVDFLLHQ